MGLRLCLLPVTAFYYLGLWVGITLSLLLHTKELLQGLGRGLLIWCLQICIFGCCWLPGSPSWFMIVWVFRVTMSSVVWLSSTVIAVLRKWAHVECYHFSFIGKSSLLPWTQLKLKIVSFPALILRGLLLQQWLILSLSWQISEKYWGGRRCQGCSHLDGLKKKSLPLIKALKLKQELPESLV